MTLNCEIFHVHKSQTTEIALNSSQRSRKYLTKNVAVKMLVAEMLGGKKFKMHIEGNEIKNQFTFSLHPTTTAW